MYGLNLSSTNNKKYNMRFASIITDKMKKGLIDLKYSIEDIEQLKPIEANYILTNRIKKNPKIMLKLRRERYQ